MSQQVTFADYLLCLEFYRKLDQTKFSALLEKVKPVAARNPADLALLMDWMNKNGLAADVLKWMEKLPVGSHHEAAAGDRHRGCVRRSKKLVALETLDAQRLRGANRNIFAWPIRPMVRSNRANPAAEAEFSSLWRSAERAADERPERKFNLARLAMKWNFSVEAEQLWLRVSKDAPSRREALDALFRIYRANNDLPNLYRTAQRLHESSPNEPGAGRGLRAPRSFGGSEHG